MHPSQAFRFADQDAILALARAHPFARLFGQTPDGPRVAHVPMLVGTDSAGAPTLRFHIANSNAMTPYLDALELLTVFEGPNGYLSANWYSDTRGNVPSWNYLAAECEGRARAMDRDGLIALLDTQSATFEPMAGENWTRGKMEPRRFDALLNAITGFELTITAMRGTRKLSQNKPADEAERLAAGMDRAGMPGIASAMRAARA